MTLRNKSDRVLPSKITKNNMRQKKKEKKIYLL